MKVGLLHIMCTTISLASNGLIYIQHMLSKSFWAEYMGETMNK